MNTLGLTPEFCERGYNNRAAVPDHAEYFQHWADDSAMARATLKSTLDVRYGKRPNETMDLFPGGGRRGLLVFIHGGYWRALDKADFSFVAPAFNAAGALVVVPNYALCPAVSIEDITWQMLRALEWTWRNAAAHGGDRQRIAVAGHSAGGHLAAMMLSARWKQVADDLPANLIGGALSISGLFDLEPLRHAPFLQTDLQLTPASVKRLSPAFFPRPKGKLYATVGALESDEFLRQNQLIRDVWGPTAVPVCETLPGRHHLDVLDGLVDPGGRLHDLALRLLGLR
jgi:arylformamidase